MIIALTDSAIWQIAGVRMPDGSTETRRAEVFGGIGIYARPPGAAEAIVANVGDASTPAIVGIRDEATRAAVAGGVKADETMLYNSKALVYVKDDETIEARSVGGTAKRLATFDELDSFRTWVRSQFAATGGHTHAVTGGTTAAIVTVVGSASSAAPTFNPPAVAGTDKLKGE